MVLEVGIFQKHNDKKTYASAVGQILNLIKKIQISISSLRCPYNTAMFIEFKNLQWPGIIAHIKSFRSFF